MGNNSKLLIRQGRRLLVGVEYALERPLPAKGAIYAKLGDEVKPETVVGEAKVSAGFRVFSLVEYLGGSPGMIKKYLRRTIGARVYAGDVVAERPRLVGSRQFVTPIDGVLQSFDEKTGQLTMQFAPASYRLPAGVRGTVTQVVPEQSVFVNTRASLLFGVYASGRMREGVLRLIALPNEMITAQAIDSRLSGYIIAGGSGITRDALNRALAVGVKGIVTGGMAADDLLAVSGSLNGKEDVGLSLLITSGLGMRPMEAKTYQFLQEYQEQQVFLLPNDKMMLLPLPLNSEVVVQKMLAMPDQYGPLEVGDTVRVLSGKYGGTVAVVAEILPARPVEGSRMATAHCLLQLEDNATIEIPVVNLELLD